MDVPLFAQVVAKLKRPYDKNGISITDPLSYCQDFSFDEVLQ